MEKQYSRINATGIIDSLELLDGKSQKTGNEYLVGSLSLKSPFPGKPPIKVNLGYIDQNVAQLIRMSIENDNAQATKDFLENNEG